LQRHRGERPGECAHRDPSCDFEFVAHKKPFTDPKRAAVKAGK
jgi:hypothetical protein